MEQPAGTFVQAEHLFEVEDEMLQAVRIFKHVAHDCLGRCKGEMPLKLMNLNATAALAEHAAFLRRAHAAGVHVGGGELEPDRGATHDGPVEQMQIKMTRQFLTDADPAHAVTVRIESRRKHADAQLP